MIGHGRYIAAHLTDGWCVWDLATGQRVRSASGEGAPSLANGSAAQKWAECAADGLNTDGRDRPVVL